jgi:hypothetical protein
MNLSIPPRSVFRENGFYARIMYYSIEQGLHALKYPEHTQRFGMAGASTTIHKGG